MSRLRTGHSSKSRPLGSSITPQMTAVMARTIECNGERVRMDPDVNTISRSPPQSSGSARCFLIHPQGADAVLAL